MKSIIIVEEKLRKLILSGDKESIREILSDELQIDITKLKYLIDLSKNKGIKIIQSIFINRIPESINYYSKNERENLIIDLISEISEDIYAASWYNKIEFELWSWIKSEIAIPEYFNNRVIKKDLEELKQTSEKLNLWAIWEEGDNPQAIELIKWKMKFE